MAWFSRFTNRSKNSLNKQTDKQAGKKPRKALTLKLGDKHDPFGSVSIEQIKAALDAEDFNQLQSLYFFMMRDLKIASAVLTRQQQIAGQAYKVESDNAEFLTWLNDRQNGIKLNQLIKDLSSAIYYGVAVVDVPYAVQDLKLVPKFELVSPRFLRAHAEGDLKQTSEHLYVKKGDKKLFINQLDPDTVVFHKHAIDIGEITDFSLASKLVWYFSLKHVALAHNLQYFDNVATPPLIAKTSGEEDDLIESLYQLKSSSVGVFGQDDVIEYLKTETQADFLGFIEYLDRQIATLILGNTLSTGEGKNGSRSQSEVHENRQKEILSYDAGLISETVETYLNRLEALNFANPKGVRFSFDLKVKKDLKSLSEVVKNISDAGFELDSADLEEQFGLKIVGKKTPPEQQNNQQNNQQSNAQVHANSVQQHKCDCGHVERIERTEHNGRNLPYDHLDTQTPSTKTVENTLVNAVLTRAKQANSFEEVYQGLLELYPQIPTGELEQGLVNILANTQLLADAEVSDESQESKA